MDWLRGLGLVIARLIYLLARAVAWIVLTVVPRSLRRPASGGPSRSESIDPSKRAPKTGLCLECANGPNWTVSQRKGAIALNVNPDVSGLDATVSVNLVMGCDGIIQAGSYGTTAVFRRVVSGVPQDDVEVDLKTESVVGAGSGNVRVFGPLGMTLEALFEGTVSAKVCGVDYAGDNSTLSFK